MGRWLGIGRFTRVILLLVLSCAVISSVLGVSEARGYMVESQM